MLNDADVVKHNLYTYFQLFVDGLLTEQQLVNNLNQICNNCYTWKFFTYDPINNTPATIDKLFKSTSNSRDYIHDCIVMSLILKEIIVYNF